MERQAESKASSAFFSAITLAVLGIFVLNNVYLKPVFHNWFTGKLSDFAFCFFFPLYACAVLSSLAALRSVVALRAGAAITVAGFASVKTLPQVSHLMDSVLSPFSAWFWGRGSRNIVDESDLIAMIIVPVAYWFGLRRMSLLPQGKK